MIQQVSGSFRELRVWPSLRAVTDTAPAGSAAGEHPDKAQHLDLPRRQAEVPLSLASGRPGRMLRRARLASVPICSRSRDARQLLLNFASAPGLRANRPGGMADIPADLDQITCPVLIMQRTADHLISRQSPRFLAFIPRAQFRWLHGFSCYALHDNVRARSVLCRQ